MRAPATFFNGTFNEALSLLIEARNYIAYYEASDFTTLPSHVRLQISYESMRITSRLTQVMAWLLTQKAVHAGEISREMAASDAFALAGGTICSDPSGSENENLPGGLRGLLSRSHLLYMRVRRLDEQFRDCVIQAAAG